jgi:signal transduction histidine kinase
MMTNKPPLSPISVTPLVKIRRSGIPARLTSLRLPHLRLYQQILLSFFWVVLIPLFGTGVAIYSINQNALHKEVSRFAEVTAQSLLVDLQTELHWEQAHATLLLTLLQATPDPKARAAILSQGGYLWWAQQPSTVAMPTSTTPSLNNKASSTQPLGAKNATRYGMQPPLVAAYHTLWQDPSGAGLPLPVQPVQVVTLPNQPKAYVLLLKIPAASTGKAGSNTGKDWLLARRFVGMEALINRQSKLFTKGLLIVNENGRIIAGPEGSATPQTLSPVDIALFNRLTPGTVKRQQTTSLKLPLTKNSTGGKLAGSTANSVLKPTDDEDDTTRVEKVMVKVPGLNWGIVLESPYHVRQTYIRRAKDQTLLLMGGYLLLVIMASLFYILGINRNFRQLLKATKALTHGNYSRRIRLLSNAATPYEIVVLAAEFNRMAKRVADAWDSTQRLNQDLLTANRKLAQLDELKSTLIDTVSHELRTPLTSIKGYTSRLLRYDDTLDPALRQKSLKIVKQQADRLSRMVDDLLVIPELENARLRVYPDTVALIPLINNVMQVVTDRTQRDIVLTTGVTTTPAVMANTGDPNRPEAGVNITADPDRLEQVLLNVLDNAVKYSPEGSPIQVAVTAEDAHVLIQVINQTNPIAPEVLNTLFEKFTRLDNQLTRTTRGSGLGLFITRGLVESMGGSITLTCDHAFFEARLQFNYPDAIDAPQLDEHDTPVSEIASHTAESSP